VWEIKLEGQEMYFHCDAVRGRRAAQIANRSRIVRSPEGTVKESAHERDIPPESNP